MSNTRVPNDARPAVELLKRSLEAAGRDRSQFGIEARIPYGDGNPHTWELLIHDWQELGATIFSVNTMGKGFDSPAAHLAALRTFAKGIGLHS